MHIITLITDMGTQDHYVAAIKGAILKRIPNVHIVDISHEVQSFSTNQAAYFLKSSFEDFPEGTIHIIGVQSEPIIHFESENMSSYPSVLKYKGHYFVGTDNGVFSLLVQENDFEGFWQLDDVLSNKNVFNFPVKNILVPAACQLALGKEIDTFATEQATFKRQITFHPTIEPNLIKVLFYFIIHYA